jgi:hypothetical protein
MKQTLNQMNAYYMLLMLNSMAGHIDCIYIHSLCIHLVDAIEVCGELDP